MRRRYGYGLEDGLREALERYAGLVFVGMQQGAAGAGGLALFQDPKTGTSFAVVPHQTIGEALRAVQERYATARRTQERFMGVETKYVCDGCGALKGETNKWWCLRVSEEGLGITPFSPERAIHRDTTLACSATCLMHAVGQWGARVTGLHHG